MGYYTKFTLTYQTEDKELKAFLTFNFPKELALSEAVDRHGSEVLEIYVSEKRLLAKLDKLAGSVTAAGDLLFVVRSAYAGETKDWKWYGHEKDMKTFSRLFPENVFCLRGEGEESGDIWIKYFQAGKMQIAKARISFDPIDPAKFK